MFVVPDLPELSVKLVTQQIWAPTEVNIYFKRFYLFPKTSMSVCPRHVETAVPALTWKTHTLATAPMDSLDPPIVQRPKSSKPPWQLLKWREQRPLANSTSVSPIRARTLAPASPSPMAFFTRASASMDTLENTAKSCQPQVSLSTIELSTTRAANSFFRDISSCSTNSTVYLCDRSEASYIWARIGVDCMLSESVPEQGHLPFTGLYLSIWLWRQILRTNHWYAY